MSRKMLSLLSALIALIVYIPAFAKGDTVKITVTNLDSGARIESTDDIVKRFGVWEGPGDVRQWSVRPDVLVRRPSCHERI